MHFCGKDGVAIVGRNDLCAEHIADGLVRCGAGVYFGVKVGKQYPVKYEFKEDFLKAAKKNTKSRGIKMKRGEIKHAVLKYLDSLKTTRIIGGWQIRDEIATRIHYAVYPTVILKICKHWSVMSGGGFDVIDRAKSIYKFTPGINKVAGTHLEKQPVTSLVKTYRECRLHSMPYGMYTRSAVLNEVKP